MSPEDKQWLIEHLEARIEHLEKKLEGIHDRISACVTWRSLGVAVVIGVGLATLILSIAGGNA